MAAFWFTRSQPFFFLFILPSFRCLFCLYSVRASACVLLVNNAGHRCVQNNTTSRITFAQFRSLPRPSETRWWPRLWRRTHNKSRQEKNIQRKWSASSTLFWLHSFPSADAIDTSARKETSPDHPTLPDDANFRSNFPRPFIAFV